MAQNSPSRLVTITTRNLYAGSVELVKEIDWNNKSDCKWLTNHMTWAVNNSRSITLQAVRTA